MKSMASDQNWNSNRVIEALRSLSSESYRDGLARFGIETATRLGVMVPDTRKLAGRIWKNHVLAMDIWDTGVHEARILAAMIADPAELTETEMETLVSGIDSWDICDNLCGELLINTKFWETKIHEWSVRPEEFVRRSAFALIAYAAVHKKSLPDGHFLQFLGLIRKGSTDERHYVRKSVDWALRQIGKRSLALNEEAKELAFELRHSANRTARWIGSSSYRELDSEEVKSRLRRKNISS